VLYLPQYGAQPLPPAPSNPPAAGDPVSAQDSTRLQDIIPPLDVAFVQTSPLIVPKAPLAFFGAPPVTCPIDGVCFASSLEPRH
jgi:hypothetical protein